MNKYSTCFLCLLFFIYVNRADGQAKNEKMYFSGIDIKTGIGLPFLQIYKIPVSIAYQRNISNAISSIVLTEFRYNSNFNDQFNAQHYFGYFGLGLGSSFGNEKIKHGFFVLGGSRLYFSNMKFKNVSFHENILETKSITPELGFAYNLNYGKKRLYFSSQIYVAITPTKNIVESFNHTFMAGIGYRLNRSFK